ncbi:hypothetical protein [Haloactinomyces albus]|uniref:RNase H-like nuclease (RuvC/YqgF family) n=1 Tax=Haloactinomyces albus TaxID=1352928 RepID=A0AAE3ZFZ5_9ACTN|nr:hypothetical protein [Haloactinomyces albus]MDR7302824.1 putative RNase H-like nuclease (RuvC/YqgF family) [Haloactinomyces albus]
MSDDEKQRINISGGSFVGAHSWGSRSKAHAEQVFGSGNPHQEDLEQLRHLVRQLVRTLHAEPESNLDGGEARWRTEELSELLEDEQPNAEHIKNRWSRLEPMLETVGTIGSVASIASLISSLF